MKPKFTSALCILSISDGNMVLGDTDLAIKSFLLQSNLSYKSLLKVGFRAFMLEVFSPFLL